MRFLAFASLFAALVGVTPALAGGFIESVPSVQVPVSGIESQAQVAMQLKNSGYTNIMLSHYLPNAIAPQPQYTTPTTDFDHTPAHMGWNGTAYKDGTLYNVYVMGDKL